MVETLTEVFLWEKKMEKEWKWEKGKNKMEKFHRQGFSHIWM